MPPPEPPPDPSLSANPPHFRVRLFVLTPLELEKRRAGESFEPHFANRDYRILWGTVSVTQDFSSAPAAIRRAYEARAGEVDGAPIAIPRAHYGTVSAEGFVSQDVVDTRSGESTLEIGEYRSSLPDDLTPELWALDRLAQAAGWHAGQHFHPLVRIPLQRIDPPVVPEASREVEMWWRLWNLGQIDVFRYPARQPIETGIEDGLDGVTRYQNREERAYASANQIAKARWNHVRSLVQTEAFADTDAELMNDLLRHHDREAPR